jgi:hypothetical protein
MSRNKSLGLIALAFLVAGPARSESGAGEVRATAHVSVSIPSMHGADIPSSSSAPGSIVPAANRIGAGRIPLPTLRVMSSNGEGSIQLVRRVRDVGAATVSSSPRGRAPAREDVTNAERRGASGWTEIEDELEVPAAVRTSNQAHRVTVVYEVWSF